MPRQVTAKKLIRALVNLKKKWIGLEEFFKKWNKIRKLLYETAEYRAFLLEVRTRANGECHLCGKRGREVHHIVRVYDDPTKCLDVDNGMLLCIRCHKKQHTKGKDK
jgi:5-methylcytosine-specific restriction endonuclease McrA